MDIERILISEVGRIEQEFRKVLPDFPAALLVDRRCEMAIDSREEIPADFSQRTISETLCLETFRIPSKGKEQINSVMGKLEVSYRDCLESLYMEQLELVPFTSSPHVIRGIGDQFKESHELGVVRYSNKGKRQKPFFYEDKRVFPNPNWLMAGYFDQFFVQPDWLIHAYPQGQEGGKWSYYNEYNFETNPDGTIGHFKGVITARFKVDLTKVLRFRVPCYKL